MAKKKEEKVLEEVQATEEVVEKQPEEVVENEEPTMKAKVVEDTPMTNNDDADVIKVNLDKPAEEATTEETKEEVVETEDSKVETKEEEVDEQPVLEEITDEEETTEEQDSATEEVETKEEEIKETTPSMELPENIEKVVNFMNDTGGTLEDYVRLNVDYGKLDDSSLLTEYYKQTKPHLNSEEVSFLLEDRFKYDEEVDEARDIKRKKLAYKEAVAEAKQHLEGLKGKYYQEVKLGSRLAPEQQKAIDFFNRYNKEQEQVKELSVKQQQHFNKETNKVFNESFKGFDFQVGNKKYRYNVKDVSQTKDAQSDVISVFSKFVDKQNMLQNAKDYHKSLFAARNADAIANHFYEQGKADAVKQMTSEAKNINLNRKTSDGVIDTGKAKVRVISGDNSSSPRFRLKNY